VEALTPCREPSQLPADLPDLPAAEAVRDVLRAHSDDVAALNECSRKHRALRDYIKAE